MVVEALHMLSILVSGLPHATPDSRIDVDELLRKYAELEKPINYIQLLHRLPLRGANSQS